jgi:hypothetical protein
MEQAQLGRAGWEFEEAEGDAEQQTTAVVRHPGAVHGPWRAVHYSMT